MIILAILLWLGQMMPPAPRFGDKPRARANLPGQKPTETRRGVVDRTSAMGVNDTKITGTHQIEHAGEISIDVAFPVRFVEEPDPSFGGVMSPNQAPEASNFPTVSVVVLQWFTVEANGATHYVGARLAIVTTGKADHKMRVKWHMEGRAIRNPYTADEGEVI